MRVEKLKTTVTEYDKLAQLVCQTNPSLALLKLKREKTKTSFSHVVGNFNATSQNNSGRCWIFSACNLIRTEVKKKIPKLPKTFEFSNTFILFYDKLEKANNFLSNIVLTSDKYIDDRTVHFLLHDPIPDGGNWTMFCNIFDKYGIVSKQAYGESYMSDNTSVMNHVLKLLLIQAAHAIRVDKTRSKYIIEECMLEVRRILVMCLGEPPKEFLFCYDDEDDNKKAQTCTYSYTPKTFARLCFDCSKYITLVNDPRHQYWQKYCVKYLGNVRGATGAYLNLSMSLLMKYAVAALTSDNAVWFGADASRFLNKTDGVFDEDQYNYDLIFTVDETLNKADRLNYCTSDANHAMLFTGINIENGTPDRFRIENSWGKGTGEEGYFACSIKWFVENVFQIVIPLAIIDDVDILEAIRRADTVVLDPWDPIGCLAA